uniref:C2 domain-containing protein n=1 Tax=Monopterus albus TaxID=43700 RepID=A0A3Q3QNQ8_MONAL
MWVLGKIRESMESIRPASLTIPEFCLPPRLCRKSPLPEEETSPPYPHGQNQILKSNPYSAHVNRKDVKTRNGDALVVWQTTTKPLPFSAEGYGLIGIHESPNTRRKESLFHSKCPVYVFDRSISTSSLSPSCSESSPLSSPYSERLQREHVLPLQGHGKVRLSTEHTAFSTDTIASFSTVRVCVVSVEGLRDITDRRTLNCAVTVCLIPGKLQQQRSATIRNCRNPVFNEDFFFTELSQKALLELQLKLKVLDKPAAGTLRRGTVIGVIKKPLSQLLPLKEE